MRLTGKGAVLFIAGAAIMGLTSCGNSLPRGALAELVGSDTVAGDWFGSSVAASGSTIVVGAAFHASNAGRAYVFTRTAAGWRQTAELKGSDTVANDYFGSSVGVSGSTIVVGAEDHASFAGAAYVFTRTATGWRQTAELKASGTYELGNSVAVSGTTIVVGGGMDGQCSSHAYVFTKTAAGWRQAAELKASLYDCALDYFGSSVAVSGTTVLVGAPYAAGTGEAYVFTRTAAGWQRTAELTGSGTVDDDAFGISVALSGTTAVVGAYFHASAAGRAYVFTRTAAGWHQTAELKGSGTVANDFFGGSVAVSGTTIVVGREDPAWQTLDPAGPVVPPPGDTTPAPGRAYVFTRTSAGWHQAAEPLGADTAAGDAFGISVAVAGTTIVVGAPQHASAAGRAYVFRGIGRQNPAAGSDLALNQQELKGAKSRSRP
jgi:hypothetical protein